MFNKYFEKGLVQKYEIISKSYFRKIEKQDKPMFASLVNVLPQSLKQCAALRIVFSLRIVPPQ